MKDVIWITQMDADGHNDHDIISLEGEGAWARLAKLPIIQKRDGYQPYDVILTRCAANGDLTDDDPLVILPTSCEWLLTTFWKQPAKFWKGLKQNPEG